MAFAPFMGFEMKNGGGRPLRLAAADVGQKLYIIVDDHPAAEPRRWRLTEKGAKMFSAENIELLVSLGYAVEVE